MLPPGEAPEHVNDNLDHSLDQTPQESGQVPHNQVVNQETARTDPDSEEEGERLIQGILQIPITSNPFSLTRK